MSTIPVACQGCNKNEAQVAMCNIYTYQFKVFGKKCPRETGFEPTTPVTKDVRSIPLATFNPNLTGAKPLSEKSATKDARSVPTLKFKEPLATNIRIAELELGAFSPRMQFDPAYITKLAADIEVEGQLKPIMVKPHPTESNRYQVVDGEHRVRALQKLGRTLVRAEVHALSDEEAYYRAMRINQLHGKPLEDLEEACHINKMVTLFGLTQEEVGKRFARSRQWVSQRLDLALRLAPKVEEYVATRVASSRHAIEMSILPKEDQEK